MSTPRKLRSYELYQAEVFNYAQDLLDDEGYMRAEKPFIPAGYCPKHYIQISNGMFDGLCNMCEHENSMLQQADSQ